MNLNKQTKFILAITLQVVIILAIIIFKFSVLSGGTKVLLEIEPIDPRSPLRGDYMTFKYEDLSTIKVHNHSFRIKQENNNADLDDLNKGDTVYVLLKKRGFYWQEAGVLLKKPKEGLFIKGKITDVDINKSQTRITSATIDVEYGAEQYFIPEGEGRGFSLFNKDASVLVSIDSNGNPVLKQMFINGESWP